MELDGGKVGGIRIVGGGYGGDMGEEEGYEVVDDIELYYNKVKWGKIEKVMGVLSKLVIEEEKLV